MRKVTTMRVSKQEKGADDRRHWGVSNVCEWNCREAHVNIYLFSSTKCIVLFF
jgi:hypothetical protein